MSHIFLKTSLKDPTVGYLNFEVFINIRDANVVLFLCSARGRDSRALEPGYAR